VDGLHHHQNPAGPLETSDEIHHRGGRKVRLSVGSVGSDERIRTGLGAVVQRDSVAMLSKVAGQVAAHHRQTKDPDVGHAVPTRDRLGGAHPSSTGVAISTTISRNLVSSGNGRT
jgi:hypothetical protein